MGRCDYRIKENYIADHRCLSWWRRHLNGQLIRQYAPGFKGRIIDLGCNHGACTTLMAQEGIKVTGVDINPEAIKVAKTFAARVKRKPDYVCASFESMPFKDGSFRSGFMFDVIEHIYPEDRKTIFNEIRRVMEPGSPILIVTPLGRHYWDSRHVDFFTGESLIETLTENGLEVESCVTERSSKAKRITALARVTA